MQTPVTDDNDLAGWCELRSPPGAALHLLSCSEDPLLGLLVVLGSTEAMEDLATGHMFHPPPQDLQVCIMNRVFLSSWTFLI